MLYLAKVKAFDRRRSSDSAITRTHIETSLAQTSSERFTLNDEETE